MFKPGTLEIIFSVVFTTGLIWCLLPAAKKYVSILLSRNDPKVRPLDRKIAFFALLFGISILGFMFCFWTWRLFDRLL